MTFAVVNMAQRVRRFTSMHPTMPKALLEVERLVLKEKVQFGIFQVVGYAVEKDGKVIWEDAGER